VIVEARLCSARARRDHLDIVVALRGSNRDDLVALTRRHLQPSPQAYIRAYRRRFGDLEVSTAAGIV
jgi:DNA-binding GntR family transcriptional regulator